jgi:hypothetical protein
LHQLSRSTPSLTAHEAHTKTSKLLISWGCLPHPSSAQRQTLCRAPRRVACCWSCLKSSEGRSAAQLGKVGITLKEPALCGAIPFKRIHRIFDQDQTDNCWSSPNNPISIVSSNSCGFSVATTVPRPAQQVCFSVPLPKPIEGRELGCSTKSALAAGSTRRGTRPIPNSEFSFKDKVHLWIAVDDDAINLSTVEVQSPHHTQIGGLR